MDQRTLCKQTQAITSDMQTVTSMFSGSEHNKGRTERREVWVSGATAQMGGGWTGLKQVVKVKRTVKGMGKISQEDAYFISSRTPSAPRYSVGGYKNHWNIENGLHWAKDVTFNKNGECTAGHFCVQKYRDQPVQGK